LFWKNKYLKNGRFVAGEAVYIDWGFISTLPPVSPSPDEVSQERGRDF